MSIMTSEQLLPQTGPWDIRGDLAQRVPRGARAILLAAAILIAGHQLNLTLQSPAHAIHTALAGAAAEMMTPSAPRPSAADLDAVARHFAGQAATIDASLWPKFAVTLAGVDKTSCVEALTIAGRTEGLVVVQLAKYRTPSDCRDSNDMTWWILP